MKNIVDYINNLRMPVMITDRRKKVAYKNTSLSSNRDFRIKRSLSSLKIEEGISEYDELCLTEDARVYTLVDAFERKTAFALYTDKFCRWYFPIALRSRPIFGASELENLSIPRLFYEAERQVVFDDRDETQIAKLFSDTAGRLFEICFKDGELPLKSLASIFSMSAESLFDDVKITSPDEINLISVANPSEAFLAVGTAIQTMYEKDIFDAELVYENEYGYIRVGEESFHFGRCLVSTAIGAIAPYNYSKSEAILALGASSCAELLFWIK